MSKTNLEARDPSWKGEPPVKKEERLQVQSFYHPHDVNRFLKTYPIIKVEKLDTNLILDHKDSPMMVYTIWYWRYVKEGEE